MECESFAGISITPYKSGKMPKAVINEPCIDIILTADTVYGIEYMSALGAMCIHKLISELAV